MAICFIENVVNDHPTGTLTFQLHDFDQRPKDKATGHEVQRDTSIVIPRGEEREYQDLMIPWDNARDQHLLVIAEFNGKRIEHRFKIYARPETAWDYVHHFNARGELVAWVEAGTQGNAQGINWSGWELWLDSRGKVALRRKWRQGLSHKDAVLLGLGIAGGVVVLSGVVLAGIGGIAGVVAGAATGSLAAGATVAGGVVALVGAGAGLVSMGLSTFTTFWSVLAPSDPAAVQLDTNAGKPTLIDVAAGKPAYGSSQYSADYPPQRANDGGSAASGGWSPTGEDRRPFWQVDLGQPTSLNAIQLVSRQDGDQPETRRNFQIWASNNPDMSHGHVVLGGLDGEAGPNKGIFNLQVLDPTPYRYVRAVKTVDEYFFIAKLHAYARPTDLAAGKPAVASSVYSPEYTANKANDGGPIASGGWSPVGGDNASFWQVDLGEARALGRIDLVTRQDGDQPETRQNFAILASNNPDMSHGHVVLAVQGPRPRPFRDVFMAEIDDPTPYRYIAVVKTRPEYFFIAKLCVYGR